MASGAHEQDQQQTADVADVDKPAGSKIQLGEGIVSTVLSVRGWQARWEAGQTGWTEKEGNVLFRNNIGLLSGAEKPLKVFVPLCGNAIEMKWLYEMGHTVVGVDCFEAALIQFCKDNDIECVNNKLSDEISVVSSTDGKLRLYACDLYEFSSTDERCFDAVWDRGSLVAINHDDRDKYARLLVSLMAPHCQYLLCVVEYDVKAYPGPPHSLSLKDIRGLYEGLGCMVKLIESRSPTDEKYIRWGLSSIEENLYLISFA